MRIMAVNAAELGITAAAHRVGVFHRIPSGHPGGELRTSPGMTAAASPIDVIMRASEFQLPALAFHEQVGTAWKKARQDAPAALRVLCAAQVAGFAADAQR